MYRERPAKLGSVLWERAPRESPGGYRVLPDGCMDLIWHDQLIIAGPDTRAMVGVSRPGSGYTGLRLPPGTGPLVFGTPAHELRDQRVAVTDLRNSSEVRTLTARLAAAPGSHRRAALLEAAAVRWSRGHGGPGHPRWVSGDRGTAGRLAQLVLAGARQQCPVHEIARSVGLSERQLHRRCLDLFGYGVKTLARVVRMRHALRLVAAGAPPARAAANAGYADQPHLSREIRTLAGVPLRELIPG